MQRFRVVVCGGGFAALEAVLRLRSLAGDRVAVTLLAPGEELIYRPQAVMTPFTDEPPRRYPIASMMVDTATEWIHDSAAWVDLPARTVHTAGRQSLPYDALLLALGARERRANPHLVVFTDRNAGQGYRDVIADLDARTARSVALIEPAGPVWPLPLYELALLTAQHTRQQGYEVDISLITPHRHPLYGFGEELGTTVQKLLEDARVSVHTGSRARVDAPGHVHLEPSGADLHPDRIVSLPTITGPDVRGIPGDALDRFIPIDEWCRIHHTDGHAFAAGDATDLPVKHGSLAAQQADTAAAGIAHLAGIGPQPPPLRPVLRGTLLTGGAPLYLTAHLVAGTSWRAQLLSEPTWSTDQLVVADELASYLGADREHRRRFTER